MTLEELCAQALAERAQRRSNWSRYARLSIEALEEVEQRDPDLARRAEIREHLVHRRRELKAEFERHEKRADYIDKSATPIAAVVFGAFAWFMALLNISSDARPWADILALAISSLIWLLMRTEAYYATIAARRNLAHLGKVD